MSRIQVSRLLKLIHDISSRPSQFTFRTSDDVDQAWKIAEMRHPTVCEAVVHTVL